MEGIRRVCGILAAAGVLVFGLSRVAAAGTNLVQNGSFEKVAREGLPENWDVPNKKIVSLDTKEVVAGEKSLKIEDVAPEGKRPFNAVSQQIKNFKPGKVYTLSAFISTELLDESHFAYISFNCQDAEGKGLETTKEQKAALGVWHNGGFTKMKTYQNRVVFKMLVPEKTATMKIDLILWGSGKAWFDAIQLEEGETASEYQENSKL